MSSIEAALNGWVDTIPRHRRFSTGLAEVTVHLNHREVRWDARPTDPTFFNQSVLLHAMFYSTQMLVHRPSLADLNPTILQGMTPALAICLNAAQGCIRVLDAHRRRGTGFIPQAQVRLGFPSPLREMFANGFQWQASVLQSSVFLLVSLWRFGNSVGPEAKMRGTYMSAVINAVRILKYHDTR